MRYTNKEILSDFNFAQLAFPLFAIGTVLMFNLYCLIVGLPSEADLSRGPAMGTVEGDQPQARRSVLGGYPITSMRFLFTILEFAMMYFLSASLTAPKPGRTASQPILAGIVLTLMAMRTLHKAPLRVSVFALLVASGGVLFEWLAVTQLQWFEHVTCAAEFSVPMIPNNTTDAAAAEPAARPTSAVDFLVYGFRLVPFNIACVKTAVPILWLFALYLVAATTMHRLILGWFFRLAVRAVMLFSFVLRLLIRRPY